jgi:hypothetical protein
MQRFFVINSRGDNCFRVINDEDATIFESTILKECLNVKNNLERSESSDSFQDTALEALVIGYVKNQNPDLWRIEPDSFGGVMLIDENGKVIVEFVTLDTASGIVEFAKKLQKDESW